MASRTEAFHYPAQRCHSSIVPSRCLQWQWFKDKVFVRRRGGIEEVTAKGTPVNGSSWKHVWVLFKRQYEAQVWRLFEFSERAVPLDYRSVNKFFRPWVPYFVSQSENIRT